ncbi:MAG: DNA-3-methyladenine glycosylase [Enterococcaceae bacterium]|jgi:DNA-3-methyladenine glycosylase|nr:DNA-3-methyladenine glycosylase [Enterococcaceae bacterium]MCI1919436.1 DNA-3-methyladenine glycosylase [Enterococcaceae bacterium]
MSIKEIIETKPTTYVAQALLGQYLSYSGPAGATGGWIVDAEAYLGPLDRAAHSYGGRQTPSLAAMYAAAGTIYLYTMHTHLILNIVTKSAGTPEGVMIRAIEPGAGIPLMKERRPKAKNMAQLTNGPGKLVEALGLPRALYGTSIFDGPLELVPEKARQPREILMMPRVGIPNKGHWTVWPLRFAVAGNPYLTGIKKSEIDAAHHGWIGEKQ